LPAPLVLVLVLGLAVVDTVDTIEGADITEDTGTDSEATITCFGLEEGDTVVMDGAVIMAIEVVVDMVVTATEIN
jgi:hypothetical protein